MATTRVSTDRWCLRVNVVAGLQLGGTNVVVSDASVDKYRAGSIMSGIPLVHFCTCIADCGTCAVAPLKNL